MKAKLEALLERLISCQSDLGTKQLVAGFDGFIDSIQKVILQQPEDLPAEYFKSVDEFGQYISSKKEGGLSLETEEIIRKIGGNVPIMANAAASLGIRAHCIGAFGYPLIDPLFLSMSPNTKLHSFAEPGITSALEFSDGKIMLARMSGLNGATWALIKERVGLDKIIEIVAGSDMLCLLNWSEVRHSTEIWQGLIREILAPLKQQSRKKVLVDLADCSKHSNLRIKEALEIVQQFSAYSDVTLSLNRNEALLVHKALNLEYSDGPESEGNAIYQFLNIDSLVIHTAQESFLWKDSLMFRSETLRLKKHLISTGAGDNFNAGLCAGQLMDLRGEDLLLFANLLAACYMNQGTSPDLIELEKFISVFPED